MTLEQSPAVGAFVRPVGRGYAYCLRVVIRARDRLVEAAVLAKLREQEPVAWKHSATGMLYDTESEVPLADGDEWAMPLYAAPQPAVVQGPQTDSYVQPVPDKCDRIVWRDRYYHLPIAAPEAPAQVEPIAPSIQKAAVFAIEVLNELMDHTDMTGDMQRQAEHAIDYLQTGLAAPEAPAQGDPLQHLAAQMRPLDADAARIITNNLWNLYEGPEAQPSVPAPWREAVKVAREALDNTLALLEAYCGEGGQATRKKARAALAQLDSLEGGE